MRATTAYINKKNLRYNVKRIKELAPNSKILAIVKANAYGHGLLGTAQILRLDGIEFLGVAFVNEGVMLRESGDTQPIVVLIPSFPEDAQFYCKYDLQALISSEKFLLALSEEAVKRNVVIKAHINIDTGMNRDGINAGNALSFMQQYGNLPNIEIIGVSTHFATSPNDIEFAKKQLRLFNETLEKLNNAGFYFEYIHAANSGAIENLPESHFNLVRPGLALYGYTPNNKNNHKLKVKPILSLVSQVVLVRRIEAGESVGYDRMFIAKKSSNIATVPIGYGDGYFKTLTNKAQCLINGKRYNIVGSICMDECMVDCGDDNIKSGDKVVLIGKQKDDEILADEIASWAGTITYEVTTSISDRVSRVYFEPYDN